MQAKYMQSNSDPPTAFPNIKHHKKSKRRENMAFQRYQHHRYTHPGHMLSQYNQSNNDDKQSRYLSSSKAIKP